MSGEPSIPPPPISASPPSSLWDRITEFATRNQKAIIYTTAGITILVTVGGYWYYTQRPPKDGEAEGKRKREKSARKKKQKPTDEESQTNGEKRTTVEEENELPDITEESVQSLSPEVFPHTTSLTPDPKRIRFIIQECWE
jgi:import receptor subunit TOM70